MVEQSAISSYRVDHYLPTDSAATKELAVFVQRLAHGSIRLREIFRQYV